MRAVDEIWLEAEPSRAGESREGRVRQLDDWSRERRAPAAVALLDTELANDEAVALEPGLDEGRYGHESERYADEGYPDEGYADEEEALSQEPIAAGAREPGEGEIDGVPGAQVAMIPASTPGRRTIRITGHGAERFRESAGLSEHRALARTGRREKPHRKPDRVAMWAVLLGLALAVGAATSSHAAVLTHVARALGH